MSFTWGEKEKSKQVVPPPLPFTARLEDYEIHETPIGHGSESVFYLARHIPLQTFVALKCINLDANKGHDYLNRLGREIRLVKSLSHPCLVPSLVSFVQDQNLWTVTPLTSAGSLLGMLANFFPNGLEEVLVATMMKEVLQAVNYLHDHNIVHGNIRAEHILVESDGQVRLSGVHSCVQLSQPYGGGRARPEAFDFSGDFEWMAPEVIAQDGGYDFKADIYSFAITILELINGVTPFHEWPPLQILLNKLESAYPPLAQSKTGLSRFFYKMVLRCLEHDPAKRPPSFILLLDQFFKQAKDKNFVVVCLIDRSAIMREQMEKAQAEAAMAAAVENGGDLIDSAQQEAGYLEYSDDFEVAAEPVPDFEF